MGYGATLAADGRDRVSVLVDETTALVQSRSMAAATRYAKLGSGEAVFVVGDKVTAAANRSALDLLDKNVLALEPGRINKLQSGGLTRYALVNVPPGVRSRRPLPLVLVLHEGRTLIRLDPAVLYLVDRNENDLYFLCDELERRRVRVAHVELIQDIREPRRMARIMAELKPTHVFHAAAFKHVPLMEFHLLEAVENNILGTWATLEAARAAGVGKFVLISTDKAVRPTSVMGATKRFVELLVAEWTRETPMRSVIVRFGNVLGSNGSVVPLFQRQIAEGGPVTVTSREATRYFMTTIEAAQLVLQAVAMRESAGKVAILEMGRPIRIWDLAEQLTRMSGLRPGIDIEIVETGLRPGEKLHEELWWETEHAVPSRHPKIMLATVGNVAGSVVGLIPLIRELVERDDELRLRHLLERAVGLTNGHPAPLAAELVAQPRAVGA